MTLRSWAPVWAALLLWLVGCGGASSSPKAAYADSGASYGGVAEGSRSMDAESMPGAPPAPPMAAPREESVSLTSLAGKVDEPDAELSHATARQTDAGKPNRVAQNNQPQGGQPPPQGGRGPAKDPNKSDTPAGDVALQRGPLLIYTAQVNMAVFEVTKALAAVEDLGREEGGFLAKRDDMTITIRVPVARFDEALRRLEKMGDVLHKNVMAEDVTEEFRDLEMQVKNARAIRDRLEGLLAKAQKVEESLQIERELGRVAGEIERLEGRMKYLRDRAAYSTITVTFSPKQTMSEHHNKFRLPVDWLDQLGIGRLMSL